MMTTEKIHVEHVTSADGTRVGYRRLGSGPGIVLVHGSMQSSASHLQLAAALADSYTVYLPDRRGRGLTGPYGDAYAMAREVEDLAAVLDRTGAENLFGVSVSGLVVLRAALALPQVRAIAAFEPALLPRNSPHLAWLDRYDREMAADRTAYALVTSMIGLELAPPAVTRLPRWFLAGFTNMAMNSEDKKAAPDAVTMRKLAPTLHYEGVLLAETAGSLPAYADIRAKTLLLGGGKGLAFLHPALHDLRDTIPGARLVELAGLDHGASADVSKANPGGKPEVIAAQLRSFYAE
ncbi:alpha/beta fold hydrolase [Hamadaea tsunoensis]|uniref:alpha/beta fold hydrolase n=1 Tax=Hamadaea tsunoensis TaxID=53368 RepID=UPI0004168EFF|nr:alpha/beta hydrolase [Hamadaea tsunoensis]